MTEFEWINFIILILACWKVSDWLIGISNWAGNKLEGYLLK